MISLKEMAGRTRFPISDQACPVCFKKALFDQWPPNYGSGGMAGDGTGWSQQYQKYVCPECAIAFEISENVTFQKFPAEPISSRKLLYTKPLIEVDGVWMTPHDMKQEDYKKLHGHYYEEAYA
jgi:rubredoxin